MAHPQPYTALDQTSLASFGQLVPRPAGLETLARVDDYNLHVVMPIEAESFCIEQGEIRRKAKKQRRVQELNESESETVLASRIDFERSIEPLASAASSNELSIVGCN